MALAQGDFISDRDRDGIVLYDTVTMYVYPIVFSDETAVELFLTWFDTRYGVAFNGYTGSHFRAYERWWKETTCVNAHCRKHFGGPKDWACTALRKDGEATTTRPETTSERVVA